MARVQPTVVACLGKRLVNDVITEEYVARVQRLIEAITVLQGAGHEIVLVGFSGGRRPPNTRTEAEAGMKYFIESLDQNQRAMLAERIFVDPHAENSIQNAENISDELREQEIDARTVNLVLVSSDYHVDRILMVDRLMPLQSLCAQLRSIVGSVSFFRAPFTLGNWPHRNLYLLKDLLTVVRVNIEGICGLKKQKGKYIEVGATTDRLIPETVALLKAVVREVRDIGAQAQQEGAFSDSQASDVARAIELLLDVDSVLQRQHQKPFFADQTEMAELRSTCDKIDEAVGGLKKFDPDTPHKL